MDKAAEDAAEIWAAQAEDEITKLLDTFSQE